MCKDFSDKPFASINGPQRTLGRGECARTRRTRSRTGPTDQRQLYLTLKIPTMQSSCCKQRHTSRQCIAAWVGERARFIHYDFPPPVRVGRPSDASYGNSDVCRAGHHVCGYRCLLRSNNVDLVQAGASLRRHIVRHDCYRCVACGWRCLLRSPTWAHRFKPAVTTKRQFCFYLRRFTYSRPVTNNRLPQYL